MTHRIIIKNLCKRFIIEIDGNKSILHNIKSLFMKKKYKTLDVLTNFNLSVKAGEIVGLEGVNGAGKSTLLRIIAGIYPPSSGIVKTKGKVVSVINLLASLQDRLTMEENIFICSAFFGIRKKETKQNLQKIIKYSGIEEFLNVPVYKFSEGMKQRLIFATIIHCNPKILLLDEIFSVGDKNFRAKTIKKIKELAKEGCSVMIASHNHDLLKKTCTRIIEIK